MPRLFGRLFPIRAADRRASELRQPLVGSTRAVGARRSGPIADGRGEREARRHRVSLHESNTPRALALFPATMPQSPTEVMHNDEGYSRRLSVDVRAYQVRLRDNNTSMIGRLAVSLRVPSGARAPHTVAIRVAARPDPTRRDSDRTGHHHAPRTTTRTCMLAQSARNRQVRFACPARHRQRRCPTPSSRRRIPSARRPASPRQAGRPRAS